MEKMVSMDEFPSCITSHHDFQATQAYIYIFFQFPWQSIFYYLEIPLTKILIRNENSVF